MTALPAELLVLALSTILLVVHVMLQAQLAVNDQGLAYNAGARDGDAKPLSTVASRAERALTNFQETYPAFIALALGLAVTDATGGIGAVGAWIWLAARVIYLPLYLFGVPWVRTLVWLASLVGLALMLFRFL